MGSVLRRVGHQRADEADGDTRARADALLRAGGIEVTARSR